MTPDTMRFGAWNLKLKIYKYMWEKIKKILQKEGSQCIIVEDGEPTYLVKKIDGLEDSVEKVNRNVDEWKAEEKQEDEMSEPKDESENQEVRVEDLPF